MRLPSSGLRVCELRVLRTLITWIMRRISTECAALTNIAGMPTPAT